MERDSGLGPTAERVAANVKKLREDKRWTLRDLAKRLTELGHPIQSAAIRRIENAVEPIESEKNRKPRRVDVDELVALAIALDAVPNRLILAAEADETLCPLTPSVQVSSKDAWLWASGELPRSWPAWGETTTIETHELRQRSRKFAIDNNPHRPEPPTLGEAGAFWNESVDVARRIADLAIKSGIEVAAWGPELLTLAQRFEGSDDYKRGDFDDFDDGEGEPDGVH